jgi:ankyrin repeat protein
MCDAKESVLVRNAQRKLLSGINSGDVSCLEAVLRDSSTQVMSAQSLKTVCVLLKIIDWNERHKKRNLHKNVDGKSDPDSVATSMMRVVLTDSRVDKAVFRSLMKQRGRTVLVRAVEIGNVSMVQLLLSHPHMTKKIISRCGYDDKHTALNLAAREGNVSSMAVLLSDPRVDKTHADKYGRTVLIHACTKGQVDVVKLLLAHPAMDKALIDHQDASGRSALCWAARKGHVSVMKVMLADPRVDRVSMSNVDTQGCNSLMCACIMEQVDVVKLLLAHPAMDKALIDHQDACGRSALYWAACTSKVSTLDVILADFRVDIASLDQADDNDTTALMNAAVHNRTHNVDMLLCNSKTSFGNIAQALDWELYMSDDHDIAQMMAMELTRRQMCAIYPSKDRQMWPKATAAVEVTDMTNANNGDADTKLRSDSADIVHNALLDSFFSAQLFDVNVLGIIREYALFSCSMHLVSDDDSQEEEEEEEEDRQVLFEVAAYASL